MSHLSILPTVLRDVDLLAEALQDLGLEPQRGGNLLGFADERVSVSLWVRLGEAERLGWRPQADGSLALVGDLQRLGRSRPLQQLIGRITRAYATRLVLREAAREFPQARVQLVA